MLSNWHEALSRARATSTKNPAGKATDGVCSTEDLLSIEVPCCTDLMA